MEKALDAFFNLFLCWLYGFLDNNYEIMTSSKRERNLKIKNSEFIGRYHMGYFGAMFDWNQSSRDDMYNQYAGTWCRSRYSEEEKEVDDWAFEERDYEFDEF